MPANDALRSHGARTQDKRRRRKEGASRAQMERVQEHLPLPEAPSEQEPRLLHGLEAEPGHAVHATKASQHTQ